MKEYIKQKSPQSQIKSLQCLSFEDKAAKCLKSFTYLSDRFKERDL